MKPFNDDEAGNLVEIETCTDGGMIAESRSVNDLNQIASRSGRWSFLRDSSGSLTDTAWVGRENWEYVWDQDDRLVQVSKGVYASGAVLENEFTVNYSYDSMGRMLRRDNGTDVTTFVWDDWDLLSETTGSVTTTYLVPDGLVWSFVRGEDVFQVHSDALGSVRVVTDSEGEVVARFEYGAWGELLPGSFDSVGLALRFVGALGVRTDLETGLYSMRHRWYDPALQRFVSRDPIGLSGGANLYEYATSQPADRSDPAGLEAEWQQDPNGPTGYYIRQVRGVNEYTNVHWPPSPKRKPKKRRPIPPPPPCEEKEIQNEDPTGQERPDTRRIERIRWYYEYIFMVLNLPPYSLPRPEDPPFDWIEQSKKDILDLLRREVEDFPLGRFNRNMQRLRDIRDGIRDFLNPYPSLLPEIGQPNFSEEEQRRNHGLDPAAPNPTRTPFDWRRHLNRP